jgi:hypothetical protein
MQEYSVSFFSWLIGRLAARERSERLDAQGRRRRPKRLMGAAPSGSKNGGACRNRTDDILLAKQALSQLS